MNERNEQGFRWQGNFRVSVVVFLVTLLLYEAVVVLTRHQLQASQLDGDELEYWTLATALRDHGLGAIYARRTLPVPLLIAALRYLVGDNYFRVQLGLSAMLALLPVASYWVAARHFCDRRVSLAAAIVTAVYPPFLIYQATIYGDMLGLLVFSMFLFAVPTMHTRELPRVSHARSWALAGFLLGIAMQVKPLYLIYLPFVAIIAMCNSTGLRRAFAASCLVLLGCFVAVLPWSAYLSAREGQLILVSDNGGETLAGGLNPVLANMKESKVVMTADGRSTWYGPGKWLAMENNGYVTDAERQLPYVELNALLADRSERWILSHPKEVLFLSERKLLYLWGLYPFWNGWAQTLLGNVVFLALLACGGLALWRERQNWRSLSLFWTLIPFTSLVALVSWGSWRFRIPSDLGVIMLAVMPVGAYFDTLRARNARG